MRPVTALRALALVTLSTGCGTKVVDLALPDGGGTTDSPIEAMSALKCETIMRADGSLCQLCYSAEGKVVTSDCSQSGADAGPDPNGVPEMCKVVPTGDSRCLFCFLPGGMNTMPCLKCEAPVKTSEQGDFCRPCGWTDRDGRCLQCFSADGTVTHDDCDMIRAPSTMTPSAMTPPAITPDAGGMPPPK